MIRPGDRLRAIAARVCRAETMERLIDPLIADLQTEYIDAVRQGRVWKSRWVRIAGCGAFLKVFAFCGWEAMVSVHARGVSDSRAARRMIVWAMSALVIVTALLELPFLLDSPSPLMTRLTDADRATLVLYLIPQALPIAVPIAFATAVMCGWAGRTISRRSSGALLAMAFICSLAMLAMLAWIVPASNQAFRVTLAGHDLLKGLHELTLADLSRQVALSHLTPQGDPGIRQLAIECHVRWALAATTFVFALFSLAAIPRGPAGRTILGLAGCGIYLAYYITVFDGTEPLRVRVDGLPPFAIAWLPNVVMALTAVVLVTVRLKADTPYESASAPLA